MIVKTTKFIFFWVLIIFFQTSCYQETIDRDYPYYYKYQIIENNKDGELKFVTQYLEVESKDYKNFIRLGFSTVHKLWLECRTETENFEWFSYINFKQDAAKQSLLEEFNIPFLSDEARGGGFEQIASDQKSTTLAFNNESIALEVQYMTSGQIIIRKAEKNDKKIGTKSIRSIDYGPTTTEEGEEVEKLLRNLKSEANAAETFLPEALRKHTEHHSRYQKLVKEMIQEILEYHPNYYFGWLDLGSYAYDFEKKPEKAFFYIKKAMKMYPDRPAAYSILYSIYVNDENLEEAGKTESTADGRLNALDRFQFDSTRIKLLIRFGKTELAEKLFEERKGLYQGKEFEYGLEVLKNSLRGEATVRDYQ